MKLLRTTCVLLLSLTAACDSPNTQRSETTEEISHVFTLTEAEKAAGWELIFDGKTTAGWHNYLEESVEGWKAEEGELRTDGGNTDLVTDEIYGNFELELEWKISPKGNSGILYLVDEKPENPATYMSGPEYQIVDDNNYTRPLDPAHKSGSNYAIHPPLLLASNPVGDFNTAKISMINGKVEHWLNGKKVVDYEIWTEEWKAAVDTTKFGKVPVYGQARKGRIAFQDHGDPVSFRNIRIRRRD